jgi:UDP-N-acetylglucosamine 3-dehydrogenase
VTLLNTVGIGIIGAGFAGEIHLRALKNISNVQVLGISDIDNTKAKYFQEKYDIKFYSNKEDLIRNPEIQGVVVATSDQHHVEPAMMAAKFGKHVLVEKPLATSYRESLQLCETFEKEGLLLAVGHCLRFHPDYREAWSMVRENKIGNIFSINSSRCRTVDVHDKLRNRVSLSLYLGTHEFDLIRWITGSEVVKVQAVEGPSFYKGYIAKSSLSALLQLENDTIATIHLNWGAPTGHPSISFMHLYGDNGAILIPTTPSNLMYIDNISSHHITRNLGYSLDGFPSNLFLHQAAAFVNFIKNGSVGQLAIASDGLKSVAIAMAIEKSIRDEKPISLKSLSLEGRL